MSQQVFRQEVLPHLEAARKQFLERARAVAMRIASNNETGIVTIDMVRAQCPPPEGVDPRVMGAVFRSGRHSPWRKIGYVQSRRRACHGRPVALFKLKSAA